MRPVVTCLLAILVSVASGEATAVSDAPPPLAEVYQPRTASVATRATDAPPPLAEVYQLVLTNLHGLSRAELDRLAVEGLLAALGPRVALMGNDSNAAAAGPLVKQATVLEDNVAYLRIGTVAADLARAVAEAHGTLSRTSKVIGMVLDLRYANGDDYAAASAAAALFLRSKRVLLDWGQGAEPVPPPDDPITLPVAVLINGKTRGAAEALAAALRAAGAGLLFGTPTAGAAATSREFALSTGQRLRIATTPVKLADGTALSPSGVVPDVSVPVNPADEEAYYAEPYQEPSKPADVIAGRETASSGDASGTNRMTRRARPSEADLVRARRQGLSPEGESTLSLPEEPARPVLQDPVLARAVDLLKGLAVVNSRRAR